MQASRSQKASGQDLREYYRSVRAYTEKLCELLEDEDYVPQPIEDVSPVKWNIAHTTWFFEEMVLKKFAPSYEEFDPTFGFLFNSYYNSLGDRIARYRRGDMGRPTVSQVFEYRKYVDEGMHEFLTHPADEEVRGLVILGVNHEQQHQELLLTDLKYTFSLNPLFPVYQENFVPGEIEENAADDFVALEAGIYEVGYDGDGFCFDNELERHRVFLEDFSIQRRLITNREYLEFIDAGGYRTPDFWHSDGWDWVNANRIERPLYWIERDGELMNYTLAGLRNISPTAPVTHVSFYEAAAFAEWKGMRLPTEFEWEAASDKFNWGLRWEWTNSAYLPYPGFKKRAGAVGEYNGKFMINQMVLRGASVVTPPGHSRPTYRNFFQPHLRWQFTGIRLAR
jgi:ergothioneine biosynthesis protein EgtB